MLARSAMIFAARSEPSAIRSILGRELFCKARKAITAGLPASKQMDYRRCLGLSDCAPFGKTTKLQQAELVLLFVPFRVISSWIVLVRADNEHEIK
jgi:hypothetical protein